MAKTATLTPVVIEVQMVLDKETPGAVRYADQTDGSVVPTLYVRKDAFSDGVFPASITVSITS